MRTFDDHAGQVTASFRVGEPADAPALVHLAQLDSARPLEGAVLVAQVGGEIRAAVSLDTGRCIADPFRRTAELVAVLDLWRRRSSAAADAVVPRAGWRQAVRSLAFRRPRLAASARMR